MVARSPGWPGPLLYGLAFAVAAPALLLWWAIAVEPSVPLPAYESALLGVTVAAVGALLMAAGVRALMVHGGGLPMNAYPPPRYVDAGVYRYISHPIYLGFFALAAGASIAAGSAGGLWLVTPVTGLALAALVLGYERHDLERRFGASLRRPLIALPAGADGVASGWERVSVYLLVLLPWLIAYQSVQYLGVPPDAIVTYLPFERAWPVIEWTEALYVSVYGLIVITPFVVRSRRTLRRFAITGLIATAGVTFIYLTVPLIAPPRPFTPTTPLGRLLAFEQSYSNTVAAFPAFHVLWPLIAADAWRSRGRAWGWIAYGWAGVSAVSCITVGMHSLADVVAAVLLFLPLRRYDAIWAALVRGAEWLANSWREWRVGRIRVINHGFYTAAGALLGFWIAGQLAGEEVLVAFALVVVTALIASVLWAQYVEGSSVLLRPLGYYGGMIGGLLATASLGLAGLPVLWTLAAIAVAMPWVQAAGRLRCLVQGCCHGGPAPPGTGIRYRHSRSRVVSIGGLAGMPIHPTPLYSILSNVVTGILLLRLWVLGASAGIILGAYFILNAAARFVEESYRAEPQTPVYARLRLYQWLAVGGLAAGIIFTTLSAASRPAPLGPMDPRLLAASLVLAVFTWLITGVDFPASSRRFSRLAPADGEPRLLQLAAATTTSTATREGPAAPSAAPRPLLSATGIRRRLGRRLVLDGVALEIRAGEIVGISGENGSGKTTLIRILAGVLRQESGAVERSGSIGYAPQKPLLYDHLSPLEHFRYFAAARRMAPARWVPRAGALLERYRFVAWADDPVAALSEGTKQKLNLSLALLADPALLLLDEPYGGFEWETYLRFWEHARELRRSGRGIVVVSHLFHDRDHLDRVLHLRGGSLNP